MHRAPPNISIPVPGTSQQDPSANEGAKMLDRNRRIPRKRCGGCLPVKMCGCVWHSRAKWNTFEECDGPSTCCAFTLGILALLFIILMAVLVPDSYKVVGFAKRGIEFDTRSGKIAEDVLSNGRYYVGLFGDMHLFTERYVEIDYNDGSGNAVVARVLDGQQIKIDVTIYYRLPPETLLDLFGTFNLAYETNIRSVAQTIIRDVAMTYTSQEFFFNRTAIQTEIRKELARDLSTKFVELTAFYIRNIVLPPTLDTNIQTVELRKQDAELQQARLELEVIEANSSRAVIAEESLRTQLLAQIQQETTNQVLVIENDIRQQQEQTEQLVSRHRSERERDVRVFEKETENLVEVITLNFTIVEQETRQLVTVTNTETDALVAVYDQETENKRLELEANILAIQKDAEKQVSVIRSQTEELRRRTLANHRFEALSLREKLQIFIAEVRLDGELLQRDAFLEAHDGVHPSLVLGSKLAEATVGQADFMDIRSPSSLLNFTV